jgi:hypothetical protein
MKKNLLALPGLEHLPFNPYPVTIQTGLPWLKNLSTLFSLLKWRVKGKGKAIPVTGPHFLYNWLTDGGEVSRPPFTRQEDSW